MMLQMDTQLEPNKHGRKRLDYEIERDRVLISEMSLKGMTDVDVCNYLNQRPGIGYQLSRQMVGYDRRRMLELLRKEHQENTDAWVTEEILRIKMVEKEAWEGWIRSVGQVETTKIVESLREVAKDQDGLPITDMVVEKIERFMKEQAGDKGFLELILKCSNERSRLRGLHQLHVKVEQETTHMVKMYKGWDPSDAWGNGDKTHVIEGEKPAGLLEDGD